MRTTPNTDRTLTDAERAHGMTMLRERHSLGDIARALGLTTDATVRELGVASVTQHAHHWQIDTSSQESSATCKVCGARRGFTAPRVATAPTPIRVASTFRRPGQLVDAPSAVVDIAPGKPDHVAGAGTMVADPASANIVPGTRELTIRDQLGHEKLRFFCSRCEYEARHFGDIVRHYQLLHERPS